MNIEITCQILNVILNDYIKNVRLEIFKKKNTNIC